MVPTVHIADLLFRPRAAMNGDLKVARAPLTYWHRWRMKQKMKNEVRPMVQRERPSKLNATIIND